MNDARLTYILGVAGISLLAAACGGERANNMQGSNTTSTTPPAAAPTPSTGAAPGTTAAGGAVAGTTAAPGAAAGTTGAAGAPGAAAGGAGAAAGGGAGSITAAMIAQGDSIFHGQVGGGTCFTCHGQDAKGTTLAPNLTDNEWIDGDGTYNYIVQRVTTGVPQPKQYPAPMPPKGGAPLTDAQVRAVAAYVYSLSHPEVGK